jgi:hypothetical protein
MGMIGWLDSRIRLRAAIEDHVTMRPSPLFRPAFQFDASGERQVQDAVDQIHNSSAFHAGIRLTDQELLEVRAAIDAACAGGRSDVKVTVNQRTGIAQVHDPLQLHPALVRLATDSFLCGVIERYLRRRIVLADVDVRRVPPMDMSEVDRRAGTKKVGTTSSHWHRDIRGRQVKVMAYLTDVGPQDSNFAFVPGTHQGHHVRPRSVEESRFSDEWVVSSGFAPVECYGPAGTTMVFDTNLLHRLRRKATGIVRDSVTFYYTPGQELRPIAVPQTSLHALSPEARALFGGRRRAIGGDA